MSRRVACDAAAFTGPSLSSGPPKKLLNPTQERSLGFPFTRLPAAQRGLPHAEARRHHAERDPELFPTPLQPFADGRWPRPRIVTEVRE
jgi:hypothetical protein